MTQTEEKSCVARVLKGKGAGSIVCILEELPDGRVLVANGKRLRVETPKMKNRKHLEVLKRIALPKKPSNRRVRQIVSDAEKGIIEQEGLLCQRMT